MTKIPCVALAYQFPRSVRSPSNWASVGCAGKPSLIHGEGCSFFPCPQCLVHLSYALGCIISHVYRITEGFKPLILDLLSPVTQPCLIKSCFAPHVPLSTDRLLHLNAHSFFLFHWSELFCLTILVWLSTLNTFWNKVLTLLCKRRPSTALEKSHQFLLLASLANCRGA